MVLVQFEYLRSDSEHKLLIGQFELTHVKQVELESTDMLKKPSLVADGLQRNVYLLKIAAKSFRDGSQGIC